MKNKSTLPTELKLTKVVAEDEKTHSQKIHYEEFPQVFGYGKTEQEAELNLIQNFIVMLKERKEKIREQSINAYYKH